MFVVEVDGTVKYRLCFQTPIFPLEKKMETKPQPFSIWKMLKIHTSFV